MKQMEVIKKYTAIQIFKTTVDDSVNIKLTYGRIDGPYYAQEHPEEIFDTEDEAIEYASKKDSWLTWLILPVVTFENF
jgi:hypothetical protein